MEPKTLVENLLLITKHSSFISSLYSHTHTQIKAAEIFASFQFYLKEFKNDIFFSIEFRASHKRANDDHILPLFEFAVLFSFSLAFLIIYLGTAKRFRVKQFACPCKNCDVFYEI